MDTKHLDLVVRTAGRPIAEQLVSDDADLGVDSAATVPRPGWPEDRRVGGSVEVDAVVAGGVADRVALPSAIGLIEQVDLAVEDDRVTGAYSGLEQRELIGQSSSSPGPRWWQPPAPSDHHRT